MKIRSTETERVVLFNEQLSKLNELFALLNEGKKRVFLKLQMSADNSFAGIKLYT